MILIMVLLVFAGFEWHKAFANYCIMQPPDERPAKALQIIPHWALC